MWRAEGVHVSKTIVVAGLVFATAASLGAQQVRNEGLSAEAQIQQRRFQFQLMEGVLEAAARQGANEVAMRAQMALPIGTLFVGRAKAKGFPLDGYGVVFDIEIPIILESQVMLSRMAPTAPALPETGNRPVAGRGELPTTRTTGVVPDDPMARSPIMADPFLADPNAFYRTAVRDRLVDVMLDYSRSLAVPNEEWLSVVARSEEDSGPTLQEPSRTLILRIKGSDLREFHEGRLTRDEAKKRIVESQF
jgi:hypothetical protein